MATITGIGFSSLTDTAAAFKEAAIMAKQRANQPTTHLALIFGTPGYELTALHLETINRIIQPKDYVFALTNAVILPHKILNKGIGLLLVTSQEMSFGVNGLENIHLLGSRESGVIFSHAISKSLSTPSRQGLCYFLSTFTPNNTEIIRGIQESLGIFFPIVGGISCGDHHLGSSTVSANGLPAKNNLAGILVGGNATFASSTKHGWQPLGRPHIINSAQGNMIQKIDNAPAINLYKHYLPEEFQNINKRTLADISLLYPLGIRMGGPRQYLIQHPVDVLHDGSLICQEHIPPESTVHLMIADKEACHQAVHAAAVEVREQLKGKPIKIILVLASRARKKILGRSAFQEIKIIKDVLGLTIPIFGMYTYGEIALGPSVNNKRIIQIHNANITIIAIGH